MAEYTLPELPYDYGALAPHISGEIMELHHSKHHATYVKGLNTALDKLAEARDTGSFDAVGGLEKNLAFNLGGHINHSVFWPNLSPDGGDKPTGELAAAIGGPVFEVAIDHLQLVSHSGEYNAALLQALAAVSPGDRAQAA